jgi:hypothetical protein
LLAPLAGRAGSGRRCADGGRPALDRSAAVQLSPHLRRSGASALPPTAIGKDWRALADSIGLTPSRTGIQLSLGDMIGLSIGWVEGLEVNLLGLADIDGRRPALQLPGFGRVGSTVADKTPARHLALRHGLG